MKKTFAFAALTAVVTLLASCGKEVEAPKAYFSYDAVETTVTFTNVSKNADSYVWNFGDGETSTEANPVHTYAAAGSYTVELTAKNAGGESKATETIVLEKKVIKVDGDFSDWNTVPAADLAVATCPANAKYTNLYKAMFCTDADYIYFYLEFNAEGTEGDYVVDPIDFYLNVDGDETTGSNSYLWENSAADYLIEGFWSNNYSDAGIYSFPAEADQTAWAWEDAGVIGSTTTCDAVTDGQVRKIEGSIMRAMIPSAIKGLKVGVFCSTTAWAESGSLPATILNEDGTTTVQPLLEVKLN